MRTKRTVDYADVANIVAAAGVTHRKSHVAIVEWADHEPGHGLSMDSYWDGGSRDEFALVSLENGRAVRVPSGHPYFDRKPTGDRFGHHELCRLPENIVLVEGGVFCGKACHARIHVRPENLAKLLPVDDGPELTDAERGMLAVFACIRSSGRPEYLARWGFTDEHKARFVELGLLKVNRAGATSITTAGRNAAGESYSPPYEWRR